MTQLWAKVPLTGMFSALPAKTFEVPMHPPMKGLFGRQRAVDTLRPSQAELDHRIPFCSKHHARGFRGNECLEIDDVEGWRSLASALW